MITLAEAKSQCRIDEDWSGEDTRLTSLIGTAVALVTQHTGYKEEEINDDTLQIARQAALLYVDYYYNGEERSKMAADSLCRQLRRWDS